MNRVVGACIAGLLLTWPLAATAIADPSDYGIESVSAELTNTEAGGHPDLSVTISIKTDPASPVDGNGLQNPYAATRDVTVDLPPGLLGNPNMVTQCTTVQFQTPNDGGCPRDSQVGLANGRLYALGGKDGFTTPMFVLKPPSDQIAARIGFWALVFPVFIDVEVRTDGDYGVSAAVRGLAAQAGLVTTTTTIWGVPADPSHDTRRITILESQEGISETEPRSSGLKPVPFLRNPTRCGEELELGVHATSYQLPDQVSTASAGLPALTGCEKLDFSPNLELVPTDRRAGMPTGVEARLTLPQTEAVGTLGTADLRDAKVSLPPGMTIAPGVANGLAACSAEQVGAGSRQPSNCPEAAKIGTASFDIPALPAPLQGAIYQRAPLSGDLFGIWLVADGFGTHVKLPGDVEVDRATGQVETLFLDNPQVPFDEFRLSFFGGPRAPLANPPCGTHESHWEFVPWSGTEPVDGGNPITIDQGCDAGAFDPRLVAGATNPVGGSASPFVMDLTRADHEQNISSVEATLPPGLLASLKGIPLCEGAAALSGACPPASRVGNVLAAVGPGPLPLWVPQPGKPVPAIYLSGPFRGAPLSFVIVTPAQAGPFDLGTVVTRVATYVDPVAALVTARSEALPQMLEGVPLSYRHIHVAVDRPNFTINPTSCEEMAVNATLVSDSGAVSRPSSRFQVGGCRGLGFRPRIFMRLMGKTRRGGHPKLRSVVIPRRGDANVAGAVVRFPRSVLLDQAHIRTVCTRVQFAADLCPKGAIYGTAVVHTPLLDQPLRGPVYLRSSSNLLPDLVASLRGQFNVELAGRIDSIRGGIRATFTSAPDAPFSKLVLRMKGGKKGLLVNGRNLCAARTRATARFAGHNGRLRRLRPVLRANCKRGPSKTRRRKPPR